MDILNDAILNGIIFFYHIFGNNLGFAIIAFTAVTKIVLFPLSAPQLKMAAKQKVMAPELNKIKVKYANDKTKLSQAQMELFKKHGVNPFAGCLPMILQLVILFALFNTFNEITKLADIAIINARLYSFIQPLTNGLNFKFLYLDLSQKDQFFIIPVLAAIAQFYASKMMMGSASTATNVAEETKGKSDDLMAGMQTQMLYVFPIMTLVWGIMWPSGIALYWFISTLFIIIQNLIIQRNMPKA